MDLSRDEFLELRNAQSEVMIGHNHLILDEDSIPWILKHIDYFVSELRGNERVELITLNPDFLHVDDDYDWDYWNKVGHAIGNLQALDELHISQDFIDDDDEVVLIPEWEILARILSYVRQSIKLDLTPYEARDSAWRLEESRSFARAIHGHPTITRFEGGKGFPYESLDTLYSALATLPALESIQLSHNRLNTRSEGEIALASHASLTELLRIPSLRSVSFEHFSFTPALCQATANVFMEGTFITNLEFIGCTFPTKECATIWVNDFSRKASVVSIGAKGPLDVALSGALSATLPSSSTIRNLSFLSVSVVHLPPIFLALGKNTGLESLKVDLHGSTGESLCTAMTDGLQLNETLESLELNNVGLSNDNADFCCRAFSFLRTNKALKSLIVTLDMDVTRSCVSAFCIDIAAMLQENASLESLIIRSHAIKAKEFCVLITVLQHNMTLKTLSLHFVNQILQLNDDESKHMATLLKKNYALESLPYIQGGDMDAITRLNKAGRRYLIEDGSSISKGVEVLSAVSSETNCVFLHLLENPTLCDRSAVEIVNSGVRATAD
jgi:hypothetical protein